MAVESTWNVTGMTCEHCDHHVATAVAELPGVSSADADHRTGLLRVTSETPLDAARVAAALEESGYALQH